MDIWHVILGGSLATLTPFCLYLLMRLIRSEEEKRSGEQARAALVALQDDVSDKFQALADTALRQSQKQFLDLAGETLAKQKEGVSGDLRELLKPVEKTFGDFGKKVDEIQKISTQERQKMKDQLVQTANLLTSTRQETTKLTNALSAPKGAGRWGEETLRNVMELAGMSQYCDFTEQTHARIDDHNAIRPDVVVRLPGNRSLIIDSKAPLDKYLAAANHSDPDTQERYLAEHAKAVRNHYKSLAAKGYWKQFETAPDFVAMFIPGENFYSEALKRDQTLFDDAARDSVIIVTPATLVALAKAIAFGWRQEKASHSAKEAEKLSRELHKRLMVVFKHINDMGKNLNSTVAAHNKLVASMETRIVPNARHFETLGLSNSDDQIPTVSRVDTQARLPNTGK